MPVDSSLSTVDVADTGQVVPPSAAAATALPYDAFISYGHAKDKALAAALQSAVQRLGKPWYRRRALRLFRDDTALTASPHLWPDIEKALGQSRFLILLASPEAAVSPWVDKEVATWLGDNGPDRVLVALTDGELDWDAAEGDFRWSTATPLPPTLKRRFSDEPRWIDLRPYREGASPRDARFTDLAADFAAALHGRPKEDLLSQEVRQQRRALRLAMSAGAALILFLALAGWQWRVAENAKLAALAAQQQATEQQKIAETQRDRAEHTLTLATQTANGLVFDLAQKFRHAGVPAATIADILDRARKLQEQLSAGGETSPALRRSQVAALTETADTLLTIGDTKGALSAAQQARGIDQGLLASSPDSTDYRRDLWVDDIKVGDVLQTQGDLGGALVAYGYGLAIGMALAQRDPGNTEWQRDLSSSEQNVGGVLQARGNLMGALAAYRDVLEIRRALAEKDPGNTERLRDLSVTDERIGDVLKAQGDLAGALAAYRDGLAIRTTLAQKDPSDTERQRDLSVTDEGIGDVLKAQGDLAGALAAYRDGLAIRTTLAQKDPGNTEWQSDLSASNQRIGDVLLAQTDLLGALAAYRDGLGIRKALVQKDPSNTEWQSNLSSSDQRIGDVLLAQTDLLGALAAYHDDLAIRRALVQKDPSNIEWQRDLSNSDEKIGDVLKAQGDLAGALAAYRDSLAIRRPLAQKDPGNVGGQTDLVVSLFKLASAGSEPAANLTEALAILRRLDAAGTLLPDKKGWIAEVEAAVAKAR